MVLQANQLISVFFGAYVNDQQLMDKKQPVPFHYHNFHKFKSNHAESWNFKHLIDCQKTNHKRIRLRDKQFVWVLDICL